MPSPLRSYFAGARQSSFSGPVVFPRWGILCECVIGRDPRSPPPSWFCIRLTGMRVTPGPSVISDSSILAFMTFSPGGLMGHSRAPTIPPHMMACAENGPSDSFFFIFRGTEPKQDKRGRPEGYRISKGGDQEQVTRTPIVRELGRFAAVGPIPDGCMVDVWRCIATSKCIWPSVTGRTITRRLKDQIYHDIMAYPKSGVEKHTD